MMTAPAVAVEFGNRVLGPMAFLIPLGVALSTFGCALSVQFGVTRLCFVAGREGHFLEPMSYIHVRRSTPGPAVALQGIITLLFIVVGDIETLIEFASFLIWVAYGSAFVSLLVLRRTHPDIPRPYKVPIIIPIFALLVAIFLSVMPIISEPSIKYLAALAFIFSGIAVYTPFVYHKIRPRWMSKNFCSLFISTSIMQRNIFFQTNLHTYCKSFLKLHLLRKNCKRKMKQVKASCSI